MEGEELIILTGTRKGPAGIYTLDYPFVTKGLILRSLTHVLYPQ